MEILAEKREHYEKFLSILSKEKFIIEKHPILIYNIDQKKKNFKMVKEFKKIAPHAKLLKEKMRKNFFVDFSSFLDHDKKQVLFFFEFKKKENYLWICKMPRDPLFSLIVKSVKKSEMFYFLGRCAKWSKPMILFDSNFEKKPHLLLIKKILENFFFLKSMNKKILPYTDQALSFCYFNNKIWLRNFQINFSKEKGCKKNKNIDQLIEIGPRITLKPLRGWADFRKKNLIYDSSVFSKYN